MLLREVPSDDRTIPVVREEDDAEFPPISMVDPLQNEKNLGSEKIKRARQSLTQKKKKTDQKTLITEYLEYRNWLRNTKRDWENPNLACKIPNELDTNTKRPIWYFLVFRPQNTLSPS